MASSGLGCAPHGSGEKQGELPQPRAAPGYTSRACGFDLDRDGIVGEPEDCRLCDGRTADPDGDGVAEDLLYVDCDAGADSPSCGAAGAPCASLAHAFALADGPGDGAEDVVCFRGTCREGDLVIPTGGVAASWGAVSEGAPSDAEPWRVEDVASWTRPRSGREARDFAYPRDPARLVGWDADADGEYPPHDPDDVAVLDGRGRAWAFLLSAAASGFEAAHFTARDFGTPAEDGAPPFEESGLVRFGARGDRFAQLFWLHDLEIDGVNRGQPVGSHRIGFNFFTRGTRVHHVAVETVQIHDVGGFLVRGSGPERPGLGIDGRDDGPLRFAHLDVTALGCDDSDSACRAGGGSAFVGWKLWGYLDGIEILDSVFDAQTDAWEPKPDGPGGALLVNATQCSRSWTVRGNRVLDFKVGFEAQGGNGAYCGYDLVNDPPRSVPRPTGDVVIEDNLFWNTYGPWRAGDHAVRLRGGDDPQRSLGDVRLARNVFASSDGFDACVFVDVGNEVGPPPGEIVIEDTVCWGSRAEGRSTHLWIGGRPKSYRQEAVTLARNLFAGLDADDVAVRFDAVPARLEASETVVDPDARLEAPGVRTTDPVAYRERSGIDLGLRSCEVESLDPAAGRFRPSHEDPCAPHPSGAPSAPRTSADREGERRVPG